MKKLLTLILVVLLAGNAFGADDIKSYVDDSGTTFYFLINDDGETATIVNEKNVDIYFPQYSYSGDVVIPDYVKNEESSYKVTAIGDYAFSKCYDLTSVVIPNTVINIGKYAFYYCNKLNFISIPENVTTIGNDAFNDLQCIYIVIPESVISIGREAFYNCTKLTQVYFTGSNYISFGNDIFENNYYNFSGDYPILYYPEGASASYSDLSSSYSSIMQEIDYSFEYEDLYFYFTGLGSDGTPYAKVIADDSYSTLENAVISETFEYDDHVFKVTKIASDAFVNATNLQSLTIPWTDPDEITFEGAFTVQDDMPILYIPDDASNEDYYNSEWSKYFTIAGFPSDGYVFTDGSLYYEVISTEERTIKIVNDETYKDLSTLNIPAEVKFNGLTFIVTDIDDNAFSNIESLTEVTVNWTDPNAFAPTKVISDKDSGIILTVPTGLERTYFYSDWSNFFTINNYIEGTQFVDGALTFEITDQYTFEVKIVDFECNEKVVIPESVNYDGTDYTITNVDDGVFCSTLKEVVVSASEPTFSADAFSNISSEAVLIVKSDTEAYINAGWGNYFDIYEFAVKGTEFAYNGVAYKITDADNELVEVTGYDNNSFPKNGELSIGTVPFNGVTYTATSIVERAFNECLALEKITIDGCTTGATIFSLCRSLQSITFTNSEIAYHTFWGCQTSPEMKITNSTIDSEAFYSATFGNVEISDSYIEGSAFYADSYNLNFEKLKISRCTFDDSEAAFYATFLYSNIYGTDMTISELEFSDCTFGQRLINSYSLNTSRPLYITKLTFNNCSEITQELLEPVDHIDLYNLEIINTDIADDAFYSDNTGLYESLVISGSKIGQQAFSGCYYLSTAEITDSQIGLYAFDSCTNLSSLIINNSEINKWAFQDCTALENLHLLAMTEDFGKESFSGCANLSKAYIDATVPPTLEDNAFDGIATGAKLYAPLESLTAYRESEWANYFDIGGYIKDETTGLYFYVLDEEKKTVEVIPSVDGKYEFESVEIPSLVGEYTVVRISEYSFYECRQLSSVVIPETVEEIGKYAFMYCNLDSVYVKATTPPYMEDPAMTFVVAYWDDDINDFVYMTLYVPEGCVSIYQNSNWSYMFFTILEYKDLSIETNFVTSPDASIVGYYNLLGQPLNQPEKGINIVQYSDGTCKKILVK